MNSQAAKRYQEWLQDEAIDEKTKAELISIADNEKEIEDRFFKELEFGTGGLRGVIGAGTNRMNRYTVGRATQGLAQAVKKTAGSQPSVVIAYDSRHQSPEFALESALVLAGNGIKAYVFEELRPTPELSFAVRQVQADAGIVITASHNPPEYNGYKVYGPDGGQLVPDAAETVTKQIQQVEQYTQIQSISRTEAEAAGLLEWVGEAMDLAFTEAVVAVSRNASMIRAMEHPLRVVYTPLHGSGNKPVRRVLQAIGLTDVYIVGEQELPDAEFSTVKSPNPEEKDAFALAIQLADEMDADLLIGTDPDCDRMGAVVKYAAGEYRVLSGNQSGALMLHYLLDNMERSGQLPADGAVIKTIVTSELGAAIAHQHGLTVLNTLTGFKYIGEKMTEFEQSGDHEFIFGYEESYGYLAGTHCRDKDAVVASMLICEAAAFYKEQGKTLAQVLDELYTTYGYYEESLHSRTMKGKEGMEAIRRIMDDWRSHAPQDIGGLDVVRTEDYSQGLDGLPKENVLKYRLQDDSWFCLRPSGTEPKIKIYFSVRDASQAAAQNKLKTIEQAVLERVDRM